jgi:hypothetical protein
MKKKRIRKVELYEEEYGIQYQASNSWVHLRHIKYDSKPLMLMLRPTADEVVDV